MDSIKVKYGAISKKIELKRPEGDFFLSFSQTSSLICQKL